MKASSATPATRVLAEKGVAYTEHVFDYVDHGGTAATSAALGVPEHEIVKTLVMEVEKGEPLIVLMHGDRLVNTKELARQLGVKRIFACKPEDAMRHSGYLIGGCSPFGLRKPMPVYLERSILELPKIYINGGQRGYIIRMETSELMRVLSPVLVDAGRVE
jgi:Cys-tRNA(Pro) deacylase